MPRTTCCVPGCCNRGTYPFPSDSELGKEWLAAIQRVNWTPKETSSICKEHFTSDDFLEEDGEISEQLKSSAVPSLFWWRDNKSPSDEKMAGSAAQKKAGNKNTANSAAAAAKTKKYEVPDDADFDEDEFQDAGAIEDSDEEYRGEEDEEDEEDEGMADDLDPDYDIVPSKPTRGAKRRSAGRPRGALTATSKRKLQDSADDALLQDSKRSRRDVPPEYPRQLNKAYKEISRLATRCQLLDAALKNKSYVTHRSRTLYQIGKYVLPHQLSFIEAQAVNSSLSPGLRRWSRRMRNISLGLHRHSRHAYNFMAKIFALPTEAELQKWGAQSETTSTEGDVACNNVTLTEAEALVDEATFDNLMSVIL
ncbi:uncharacterized protein LOC108664934 [Hyalella azteca]|uniref:Uncharacterized protein LOC108664934 n=1 Tax=Hyalella azteca TaxID=294128 RepID=A0A8B7N0U6_HYAAZ|nr:uncharacterized protein LOC108664934 [Hyalella azteca]